MNQAFVEPIGHSWVAGCEWPASGPASSVSTPAPAASQLASEVPEAADGRCEGPEQAELATNHRSGHDRHLYLQEKFFLS